MPGRVCVLLIDEISDPCVESSGAHGTTARGECNARSTTLHALWHHTPQVACCVCVHAVMLMSLDVVFVYQLCG